MNILVVTHYQGDGSPCASFIHEQVRAYEELGHNVRCVISVPFFKRDFNNERFSSVLKNETVDGIEYYFYRYLSISRLGSKSFNARSAIVISSIIRSKVLKEFTPDIIHAHTLGEDSEIGYYFKKIVGVPLVVTSHGSDAFLPLRAGRKVYLKNCIESSDCVVCVSGKIAGELKSLKPTTQIKVILNGFNKNESFVSRKKKRLLINQTGSLISRKKQDVTIKAVSILKKKYPDVRLDIIGEGPQKECFEKLCEQEGIVDNVTFKGQLSNENVQKLMSESQFFVMPSIREGFGIVYLEAMAAECITIGTLGEGISDVITSGVNGFLVAPDSAEAIADIIDWCVENKDRSRQVARNGRKDSESLTWTTNAKKYIDIFADLCKKDEPYGTN